SLAGKSQQDEQGGDENPVEDHALGAAAKAEAEPTRAPEEMPQHQRQKQDQGTALGEETDEEETAREIKQIDGPGEERAPGHDPVEPLVPLVHRFRIAPIAGRLSEVGEDEVAENDAHHDPAPAAHEVLGPDPPRVGRETFRN